MTFSKINPQPGQESVWDYPRPPRLESFSQPIQIWFNDQLIVDTSQSWRVLETSHPPVYYIPRSDIQMNFLNSTGRSSFCEFKGSASYWTIRVGDREAKEAAWSYEDPTPNFAAIQGHLAFYASRMDRCIVNGEIVQAQSGDFYGGWITSQIVGPFKGGPGTWGW